MSVRRVTCDTFTPWWRHQMEIFSTLLALCAGNHRSPVISLHKGQWRGAFMFSLICAWINGWVNNREGGDLRRHRAHYDVIAMISQRITWMIPQCQWSRSTTIAIKSVNVRPKQNKTRTLWDVQMHSNEQFIWELCTTVDQRNIIFTMNWCTCLYCKCCYSPLPLK